MTRKAENHQITKHNLNKQKQYWCQKIVDIHGMNTLDRVRLKHFFRELEICRYVGPRCWFLTQQVACRTSYGLIHVSRRRFLWLFVPRFQIKYWYRIIWSRTNQHFFIALFGWVLGVRIDILPARWVLCQSSRLPILVLDPNLKPWFILGNIKL